MSTAQKEKVKRNLIEKKLMFLEENLLDGVQAGFLDETSGILGTWQKGILYFTDSGLIIYDDIKYFKIPYYSIVDLKKSNCGILPNGITVVYLTEQNQKKELKISVQRRNSWIEFMDKFMKK